MKSFQNLTIRSTSLLLLSYTCLQNDDFATGWNRSNFIQLILLPEQKKVKSSEASRSLPGHASIILASAPALLHEVQLAQARIHVTYVCERTYVDTMYISNLYISERASAVARSAASASEHSCNVGVRTHM